MTKNGAANGYGRRRLYRLGGCACFGMATVGTILPLLPTTPFLLLAAWLFSKSSPALRDQLYQHPCFGPFLQGWQEERAIPGRAKAAGLVTLLASWSWVVLTADTIAVPAVVTAIMAPVGTLIATRPSPRRLRDEAGTHATRADR